MLKFLQCSSDLIFPFKDLLTFSPKSFGFGFPNRGLGLLFLFLVSIRFSYYPLNYVGGHQAKIDKPIERVPSCGSAVKKNNK